MLSSLCALTLAFALPALPQDADPPPAPRVLDDRALANLTAFARLFGYVRHFHPSDAVEEADWEELAVAGVLAIEGAGDAEQLALAFERFFAPLAPTVRVHAVGLDPELPPELARPEAGDAERRYVRAWEHVGFGQPGGAYSSRRSKKRLRGEEWPEGVPDPAAPFRAELGSGLSCLVPLALYADRDGTLPRGDSEAADADPPRESAPGEVDRATRLAAVIIAWNILQHFYPYFDVALVDWPAELERALRAAAVDPDERTFLDTLRRMVAALHDGHGGVYHSSDSARSYLPLRWDWIEGALVVTWSAAGEGGAPAPGDIVVAIDGVPVEELIAREERLISGATPQWIRTQSLARLLACASSEPRRLALRSFRRGDEPVEIELRPSGGPILRAVLLPQKIEELADGVFYVDLDRVTGDDFAAALPKLAAARGIVFDLRGYPSNIGPEAFLPHLSREPLQSAIWNFPIVARPDREGLAFETRGRWNLAPAEPYLAAKRAFLVGGGAISYAESCLGIVEHYGLAELVGGPSAGTNGNVNPFSLPGGYGVSWTGMQVLKHDGSRHHGVGILPTLPVEPTRAGVADGRDEVLEAAVEAVLP